MTTAFIFFTQSFRFPPDDTSGEISRAGEIARSREAAWPILPCACLSLGNRRRCINCSQVTSLAGGVRANVSSRTPIPLPTFPHTHTHTSFFFFFLFFYIIISPLFFSCSPDSGEIWVDHIHDTHVKSSWHKQLLAIAKEAQNCSR